MTLFSRETPRVLRTEISSQSEVEDLTGQSQWEQETIHLLRGLWSVNSLMDICVLEHWSLQSSCWQQSNALKGKVNWTVAQLVSTWLLKLYSKSAVTIQVGLGSVDGDSPTMVKVFVSQASWTFNGLIAPAVLRLASNVALNSNVNVIALPTVFGPEDWSQAAILGWCNSREYPWTTQFLRAVTPYFGPDFRNGEIWIVFSINFLDYGDEGAPFVTIENGIPVLRGLGFAWDWMWGSAEGYTALKAIEVKNHLQFISDVTGLPIRLSWNLIAQHLTWQ